MIMLMGSYSCLLRTVRSAYADRCYWRLYIQYVLCIFVLYLGQFDLYKRGYGSNSVVGGDVLVASRGREKCISCVPRSLFMRNFCVLGYRGSDC
jgi:hypothetical protein